MDATALEGGCILGGILGEWVSIRSLDYACSIEIGLTYLNNCVVEEGLGQRIHSLRGS